MLAICGESVCVTLLVAAVSLCAGASGGSSESVARCSKQAVSICAGASCGVLWLVVGGWLPTAPGAAAGLPAASTAWVARSLCMHR